MTDPRRTQLFDWLVPGRGSSPAFSAADPDGGLIARVLALRPDLAGAPDRILAALPEAFGPDDIEAYAAADPPGFEALLELVFGAYFLSPAVRRASYDVEITPGRRRFRPYWSRQHRSQHQPQQHHCR